MSAGGFYRHLGSALLGLGVGALFLWLALRDVVMTDVGVLIENLDGKLLLQAAALYWLGLGLRIWRWQLLLRELAPAPLAAVGETLVVGYAINNLLPARLGEVARAAYAKRRLRIGRARVFGSIVVERLLDLGAILGCLLAGLVLLRMGSETVRLPTFELVALNAGAVIGVVILGIAWLRSGGIARIPIPDALRDIFDDFVRGIASLNRRSVSVALLLSGGVWLCEVAALGWVFAALDILLSPGQAMLVMGAASLSTLVPTAPGYLGTYQLVAVLAMEAFGHSASAGIVASGAIQVVLFGSVTVAGLAILSGRGLRRLYLAVRTLSSEKGVRTSAQSSSEKGVKSVSRS